MNPILLECCTGAATVQKYCNHIDITNCQDVCIVGIICATIVLVALFAKCTILSLKNKENQENNNVREDKKTKEKEEYNRKKEAEQESRNQQKEDDKQKYKDDLMNKKLQLLNDLCYKLEERADVKDGKEIKKYEKVLRESDSPEVQKYLDALDQALGITTPSTGD